MDPLLRDQLAREAGEGVLARTGGKAIALLHRIRKWKVRRVSTDVGNRAIDARAAVYKESCQNQFEPGRCNFVRIAMDASRMGEVVSELKTLVDQDTPGQIRTSKRIIEDMDIKVTYIWNQVEKLRHVGTEISSELRTEMFPKLATFN